MNKKLAVPKICPITYMPLKTLEKYSPKGLKLLSPKLQILNVLPYSAEQQREEARDRADKMSIQGVQPKLIAKINIKKQGFEICDRGGNYILKPQSEYYPELPENEDLSMRLAHEIIEVPLHGLIYSRDGSFTYFIKRFDRAAHSKKIPVEDFAQLAGLTRDLKYNYSMEKLILIIEKFCTFPVIEKAKLFTRTIFNYLIGNEDMHVKNFSLITRNNKVELAPAYDFINTTIAIKNPKEEIALPLNGKKNNLKRKDLIDYYAIQKIGLNVSTINEVLENFQKIIPTWELLIKSSFLSAKAKENYLNLLAQRCKILGLEMTHIA